MDFNIPQEIADYLVVLDKFIEDEIKPLEEQDDNIRFFDHRREWARTDFENGGLPRPEWEALLKEAKAPRRCRWPPAICAAQGVWRPGRHQSRHGRYPRASRPEGPRPAQ
jgi:hypothetical protein